MSETMMMPFADKVQDWHIAISLQVSLDKENFISKPQFSKLYPQGESVSKKKETIFISRPNISMQFDTSQSKKPKGEYYLHL